MQLQHFLRVKRANYEASWRIRFEGYTRDYRITHFKVVFHYLGDVGARDADLCLLFDGFLHLHGCVYAFFLELLDCIKRELELALSVHLFLPQAFYIERVLLYLTNQLANKPRRDSELCSCLFVAQKLYSNSLPDLLHNICSKLPSIGRLAPARN